MSGNPRSVDVPGPKLRRRAFQLDGETSCRITTVPGVDVPSGMIASDLVPWHEPVGTGRVSHDAPASSERYTVEPPQAYSARPRPAMKAQLGGAFVTLPVSSVQVLRLADEYRPQVVVTQPV